jgi:hypothetical protein
VPIAPDTRFAFFRWKGLPGKKKVVKLKFKIINIAQKKSKTGGHGVFANKNLPPEEIKKLVDAAEL